jgi:hypothetical protein
MHKTEVGPTDGNIVAIKMHADILQLLPKVQHECEQKPNTNVEMDTCSDQVGYTKYCEMQKRNRFGEPPAWTEAMIQGWRNALPTTYSDTESLSESINNLLPEPFLILDKASRVCDLPQLVTEEGTELLQHPGLKSPILRKLPFSTESDGDITPTALKPGSPRRPEIREPLSMARVKSHQGIVEYAEFEKREETISSASEVMRTPTTYSTSVSGSARGVWERNPKVVRDVMRY